MSGITLRSETNRYRPQLWPTRCCQILSIAEGFTNEGVRWYCFTVRPAQTVRHTVLHAPIKSIRVSVLQGPEQGLSFLSDSDTISIGSEPGNDLVLTDNTVSRYHVELEREDDRVRVLDQGSTNGTWIGATRVERVSVSNRTVLRLGRSLVEVQDGVPVKLELYPDDELHGIRARSVAMRRLMAQVARVAQSNASVLFLGETGTGKELFARAVHSASQRNDAPFEVVDCGALVPTLVASELFGHERGAFTGARERHIGAFERAHGGTVFLDEIGELPASLQTQLLGVLERKVFRRVGGTAPVSVDVRVVAATHRHLRKWVNRGDFRQDLYYRIAVARLRIPSLRDRAEDIPLLVNHFLHELEPGRDPNETMPAEIIEQLKTIIGPAMFESFETSRRRPSLLARFLDSTNLMTTSLSLLSLPTIDSCRFRKTS